MRVPLQIVGESSTSFAGVLEIPMLLKSDTERNRLLGGGLPEKEIDPKQPAVSNTSSSVTPVPSVPATHTVPTSDQRQASTAQSNIRSPAGVPALELLFWTQDNNVNSSDQRTQLLLELQPADCTSLPLASLSPPSETWVHARTSDSGSGNRENEDSRVDFSVSEGEWLVYQHELKRLLPFARYAGQQSSQSSAQFTTSQNVNSGSTDNAVREVDEREQNPDNEQEMPVTFSPEWVTSMLSLIAELQASGQILIPSALRDMAFITAASNVVTSLPTSPHGSEDAGNTTDAPPPHSAGQPLRQTSTVYIPSQVIANSTPGVGDRVRFSYPEGITCHRLVSLVHIVNEGEQDSETVVFGGIALQQAPAEPSLMPTALSTDRTGRRQYLERLASEGEVRSSIVPTSTHQSEPNHSKSRILLSSQVLIKRSSSTPAISATSMTQRRFPGLLPLTRSQAAAAVPSSTIATTAVVSQPTLIHDDTGLVSRTVSEHTRTGTEPFLVTEEVSLRQTTRSETAAVRTSEERDSVLNYSPVHRISAAREETTIPVSKAESSTRAKRISNPDQHLTRTSPPHRFSSTVYQEQQSECHPMQPSVNDCITSATNTTSSERLNKSENSKVLLEKQDEIHCPGQMSSPTSSSPLSANTTISAALDATAREVRTRKINEKAKK